MNALSQAMRTSLLVPPYHIRDAAMMPTALAELLQGLVFLPSLWRLDASECLMARDTRLRAKIVLLQNAGVAVMPSGRLLLDAVRARSEGALLHAICRLGFSAIEIPSILPQAMDIARAAHAHGLTPYLRLSGGICTDSEAMVVLRLADACAATLIVPARALAAPAFATLAQDRLVVAASRGDLGRLVAGGVGVRLELPVAAAPGFLLEMHRRAVEPARHDDGSDEARKVAQ